MASRRTREVLALIRKAEQQGFRVKQTRAGYIVYAKRVDLGQATLHRTPSDHRTIKNNIADLRKIGVDL